MQLKLTPLNVETMGRWVAYCANPDKDELDQKLATVSIFYGRPYSEVIQVDLSDLNKANKIAIDRLNNIKHLAEPTGQVIIQGRTFKFEKNISKIKVAKISDIKKLGREGILKDPSYVLSVLYDEVGDNPLTREKKKELFNLHFPVPEYLAVSAFFLQQSEILKLLTLAQQNNQIKQMTTMIKESTGSPWQTRYMSCRRTLIGMWMWLHQCIIHLFYFGKSFSLKSLVNKKSKE